MGRKSLTPNQNNDVKQPLGTCPLSPAVRRWWRVTLGSNRHSNGNECSRGPLHNLHDTQKDLSIGLRSVLMPANSIGSLRGYPLYLREPEITLDHWR